ncbi:MAG: DNA-directed RNA polymerase subunit beta [Chloroflexi bacterium]|nr:MAG: DNA-directed RNA polymerase subunit beta [Chloroflexota bacterium]TMG14521.1 MAG: DNA-directed RNA polymerase subunit beta [Chloroflexota bacterium]TMG16804.1 MAG: DNA-directed RNA polymerase subunit beta [Chloroflexota bacterium]TMG50945.1 MAG: DNA-directed RNA polymerase subunit beta [Chloroflexota bacterium]
MIQPSSNGSRVSYGRIPEMLPVADLIETQIRSFNRFKREGLRELFEEINPITDYTGKNYELKFLDYEFGQPKFDKEECRNRDMTFAAPLRINTRLTIRTGENAGEIKESEVFMGDFPIMTEEGTFIVNGTERVVVSQLVRSPGIYFTSSEDRASGRMLYAAKLIPNRGAWLEIETSGKDILTVKIDRKRKIPVTTLVRALGYGSNNEIKQLFADVDNNAEHKFIQSTLDKDSSTDVNDALVEMYKKIRPGDPPTVDNARALMTSLFFNPRRFDLSKVGRFKLNRRLGLGTDMNIRTLSNDDFIAIIRKLIELNNGTGEPDDIDHLGNRRVRAVGELLQNQFRMGLIRMERIIKERMTICDAATVTAASLINARPVVAAIKEFFGSSQLSQFMDQTNPLAELTHKRRLSALGPGGLSRERAGFDVRDVHHSHYGRICPIETPEGPNIGLMGSLATFARVNEYGFIETPFRRVFSEMPADKAHRDKLVGRTLRDDVFESANRRTKLGKKGDVLDRETVEALVKAKAGDIPIKAWVSDEVQFLSADEEDRYIVAQANAPLDQDSHFTEERTTARTKNLFLVADVNRIEYMDVSPKQTVSVATALIPFLEHDDANRALMGSNMQRQAVPLVVTEAPIVGTGMESAAAKDSGELIVARVAGTVVSCAAPPPADSPAAKLDSFKREFGILLKPDDGSEEQWYAVHKFERSNQGTCLSQRVIVKAGDHVEAGTTLADGPATSEGELALGRNILVAFMPWEGYNYEDAILISESVVREDKYTSIHIEEYEIEARDTKLGPEEITRDIPNVSDETLKNLDERGIVYIGAEVHPGDILVGKITPKGESELSAEERLLRAIFGEKAREVRDSSLRVPHGERGIVVDVKIFSRETKDELAPGVNQLVRVYVAQKRKIAQGDKMAGRHGNKGVIARILPTEDMPYMPDGTPVELVLNPLGVPSRMNLGQVLETHLGWAAHALGLKVATPVFDGASEETIEAELVRSGLPESGKITLRDGRHGEPFDHDVTVGYIYMLKLAHLVEDKIHARSTGPYSLVTQQPLGGKAQFGGQRFGEMEVWALEAYGASHILQEILTVKSDDIVGRVKAYEAIVKGENTLEAGIPESFRVLVKELEGLALGVEIQSDGEKQVILSEDDMSEMPLDLGINLERDEIDESDQWATGAPRAAQNPLDSLR